MAKLEFLRNLKTARNLFFHGARLDTPDVDSRAFETQSLSALVWLSPSLVKGFDLRDFPELPPTRQKELKQNVEQFERVAKRLPTKPPTPKELNEAKAAFLKMIDVLGAYLANGSESEQVRQVLQKTEFPTGVLTWEYELGADSTGDPAIWVWVIVDDSIARKTDFRQMATDIAEKIRRTLSAAGISRWPYIRFRTASEQRELLATSS